MDNHMKLLGLKARDRVTKFEGIITSLSYDLYGCVQFIITPVANVKSGELRDGVWFDEKRLEIINKKPVMVVPTFETIPGPAHKPRFSSMPIR